MNTKNHEAGGSQPTRPGGVGFPGKPGLLIALPLVATLACQSITGLGEDLGITATPTPSPTPKPVVEMPEPDFRFEPAEIQNDKGGPVVVTGEVAYTNPFFAVGVAQPIVILEDQAGFVDRDRNFEFPIASQVLGQITSDFFSSPFTYSLSLPQAPQGSLRDVDQDGEGNSGLMVFAVAYWTNTWGDPFLERRDQGGGGWSGAYASTRVSDDQATYLEVQGGKLLIFAPDDQQGFPSGFGGDGLLFTGDDPIVGVPAGWTLVDLDQDPFLFDRSSEPQIDLLEPESSALDDFSDLSYTQAFEAMLGKFRTEYAFTEHKQLDWDTFDREFRPRFEQADQSNSKPLYLLAMRDFLWSIPDGHVGMGLDPVLDLFWEEAGGGLGLVMVQLSDGRLLVSAALAGLPAEMAGIQLGAEILEINGLPAASEVAENVPWFSPYSTEHAKLQDQLRFALRFPISDQVSIRYQNPGQAPQETELETVLELDSLFAASPLAEFTGFELPVESGLLPQGIGFVQILDFFDNEVLTIQLWERMIQDLHEEEVNGLVIDLRFNGGGSGYLARQMAAYFFDQELVTGITGRYDDSVGDFYFDEGDLNQMIPPAEALRYSGDLVVIVGPSCASACEFFAYALTLQNRATVLGIYPTAGLGGSVEDFEMPENITVRFTIGRAVDAKGSIHIEGSGVLPSVLIPLDETTFFAIYRDGMDVELQRAIELLSP